MKAKNSIALTGFMGVGKSSVARHLSAITGFKQVDLDRYIEKCSGRKIAEIFDHDGEAAYRDLETEHLKTLLADTDAAIVSLGGGTWTIERNRAIIRSHGLISVWLESTFEHCWQNIRKSRKERPLARNKKAAQELFDSRQSVYCLADWHFIVRPEFNSYEIAQQIAEQVLS
ncbi:shikimate kinase [Leptolyngbya sp. 7M]|uniref:shikimate kinase n=1 Tax=Leptolyngbya sp. 7M TaxID=2812896 RepID=UPI001B8CA5A5|nr:shikimate kinase [Leptolyngbya sp. 7M]QYO66521.1 shikimate kinase [Leptolyngbya sp. 7M]